MTMYIMNVSGANLSLLNNQISLLAGQSVAIAEEDANSREVRAAINRGWANVVSDEPEQVESKGPEFKIEVPVVDKGSLEYPVIKAKEASAKGRGRKVTDTEDMLGPLLSSEGTKFEAVTA